MKMERDEINEYIWTEIMGGCRGYQNGEDCHCPVHQCPDYCSDDSPRRLLNEVVAKMVTGECETDYLRAEHFISQIADVHTYSPLSVNGDIYSIDAYAMAFATAEQIARACVESHRNLKK
jgi:hypothetical protein